VLLLPYVFALVFGNGIFEVLSGIEKDGKWIIAG